MRVVPVLALVVTAAAVALAVVLQPASARSTATMLDRTLVCAVGVKAGVRSVEIHAQSGTRSYEQPSKWKFPASASVRDRSSVGAALAWIAAGWPVAWEQGQTPSNAQLSYLRRCAATSRPVPLTTRGLSGFPASPLDDEYHCVVPRKVLVRVRAAFRSSFRLRLDRKWGTQEAHGIVRQGALAIRTESGKAVALATVNENGKARLYISDRCEPDLISSDG